MKTIRMGWALTVLLLSLLLAMPAGASEPDGRGPFADVDGSPHEGDVAALWAADVTSGCDEWLFCPDDPVSREEMAAFLTRALELTRGAAATFDDSGDSPFLAEISALAAAGITDGCAPELFCPEAAVTRGQMASFLARALDLPADLPHQFTDVYGSPHESAIAALAVASITHGCGQDRFCPDAEVTRAQMASFLVRALGLQPPAQMPEIPAEVSDALVELGTPAGPGVEGWRPLVEHFFAPADVDRALRIMACESKGDPNARNPYSGASGLFQHMPRYWSQRSSSAGYGGQSIFDPVANVAVAAWLVYDYPGGGWGHWVCR